MQEETILNKLERLFKIRRFIKDRKMKRLKDLNIKYGRWNLQNDEEEDEDDDLLSRDEFMEETLKEYMYQFGLSIYQNKKGNYYFKQFSDESNQRGFDELDTHHFIPCKKEQNFLEKLLEVETENKINLIGDIEPTVLDLYEKDPFMVDVLEHMLENEMTKYRQVLNEDVFNEVNSQYQTQIMEQSKQLENENPVNITVENQQNVVVEDMKKHINPEVQTQSQAIIFPCGQECDEKVKIAKPLKIRRARRSQKKISPVVSDMVKGNTHNR